MDLDLLHRRSYEKIVGKHMDNVSMHARYNEFLEEKLLSVCIYLFPHLPIDLYLVTFKIYSSADYKIHALKCNF